MKIGRVYANAKREEDRANRVLIEMGAVVGDGLLGIVAEAMYELHTTSIDYGRHDGGSSEGIAAIERMESAWVKLFAALKAIEEEAVSLGGLEPMFAEVAYEESGMELLATFIENEVAHAKEVP